MAMNMTAGRPVKLILLFTMPLLIGNLFQQLYNMADTYIVGQTLGVSAVAAVGCTGSINFLILGFVGGFTSGLAIVTAQRYGAGDLVGVRKSFAVSIVLSALVTVVLTALSVPLTRALLKLLQTPDEILDDATAYIQIIFWGMGAAVLFNLLSNALRAVGDSRTPLFFLVIACLINIVLDYALILWTPMGVAGAAVATVAAQLISGLLCLRQILKHHPALRPMRADFLSAWGEMWASLRQALPMGFQMSIIAIGAVVLQYALNGLGTTAVAAFTAAGRVDTISTLPMMSFGVTMATYVAQNYGAGDMRRIRRGVLQCVTMACAFALVMGLVCIFWGDRMARVFVGADPEAVRLAHIYLTINGAAYPALALLLVLRYSLQGMGKSMVPTVAGAMELIMRVFAAVVLAVPLGYAGVCLAGPLAWIGSVIPLCISLISTLRHAKEPPAHSPPLQNLN